MERDTDGGKVKTVLVKISNLKAAEYNPRKWSPEATAQLKESITRFGIVEPIVVNSAPKRNGVVIGGHFRMKVAQEMGYKDMPVVYVNIPELEREKELNVRLNRNTGEFDFDLLKAFDKDLLKDIGFDSGELDKIFGLEAGKTDADDAPPVPEKPKSKTGDIYQLGRHRVMCCDCTNEEHIASLMAGKLADMSFSDPPYGVDYGAKNRFLNSFQPAGRNLKDIANDMLGKDELLDMLVNAYTLLVKNSQDHCSYYVTAPQGGELGLMMMMMMMMMMSGIPVKHVLIWVKNTPNFSLGRLDYEYQHEPILFTWKKTHKKYMGGEHKTSVWEIDKPRKADLHPTMKPVELIINAIKNSSKKDDIVVDTFLGSGSTLIACEQTGRICYGCEIDPAYVDVVVARWESHTGKKAELCGQGNARSVKKGAK